jgi:hypothetical protein
MKFVTEIQAICPRTGELLRWAGPHIEAISEAHARIICDNTGLGYCKIVGRLVAEVEYPGKDKAQTFVRVQDFSNDN